MTYHSRPNVDQLSRDLIEDLGLHLPVNTILFGAEDHLAHVAVGAQRGKSRRGHTSRSRLSGHNDRSRWDAAFHDPNTARMDERLDRIAEVIQQARPKREAAS